MSIELDIIPDSSSLMDYYRVVLTRFKGFESFTMVLPAQGVILLDGPNGVGKTTLMDAISFALYDGAKNTCYPRSGRNSKKKPATTSVHLSFPINPTHPNIPSGLVIYRQRRPNLLQVSTSNLILVDDPAQEYLNHLFGSGNAWAAGGYIKPGEMCAFLTMTSSEKLRFIQELSIPNSFDLLSFDLLFDRLNDKIAQTNTRISEVAALVKVYQEMYLQLYERSSIQVQSAALWSNEFISQELLKYGLLINLSEIQTYDHVLNCLNELRTLGQTAYSENIQTKRYQIVQIQSSLTQLNSRLTMARQLEDSLNQLDTTFKSTEDPTAHINQLEQSLEQIHQQLALAEKTAHRVQLLAVKTQFETQLSQLAIPSDDSQLIALSNEYTLSMIDQWEQLEKGPSVDQINQGLTEISSIRTYQSQVQQYRRRQQQVDLVEGLKNQLKELPEQSAQGQIDRLSELIWTSQLSNQKMTCPKCQVKVYLKDNRLEELPESHPSCSENISELTQLKLKLQHQETRFNQRAGLDHQLKLKQAELDSLPLLSQPPLDPRYDQYINGSPIMIERNNQELIRQEQQLLKQREMRMSVPSVDLKMIRALINYQGERTRLIDNIKKISDQLAQTSTDSSGSPEQIQTLTQQRGNYKKELDQARLIQQQRSVVLGQINQVKTQLEMILRSPDGLILNIDNLVQVKQKFEADLNQANSELTQMESECQQFGTTLDIQLKLAELTDLYDKHQNASNIQGGLNNRLACLHKIRSTLITAEYVILERNLNKVNLMIADVLGTLFTDPVTVTLRSLRQLKTSDRIKPEINLEIIHKGDEFSSLNDVSGGERGRISLALLIAFARFSRVPFLFLDESLTSLDVTTQKMAVTALRDHLENKLVMTVHHGAFQGIYDTVVKMA